MSDVVRNILANALVDNSTAMKCLEPYVQILQTPDATGTEKTFGQFTMQKMHNTTHFYDSG